MGNKVITASAPLTSGNIKLATLTYGGVTYTDVNLNMTPGIYSAVLSSFDPPASFSIHSIKYTVNSSTPSGLPPGSFDVGIRTNLANLVYTPILFAPTGTITVTTTNNSTGTMGRTTSGNLVFYGFNFVDASTSKSYHVNATPSDGIPALTF